MRCMMYIDGGFFWELASLYYARGKPLGELMNDIHQKVGGAVVSADLFTGRFSASSAIEHGVLAIEREYESRLLNENIQPHYSIAEEQGGRGRERGVDVALAVAAVHGAMTFRPDRVVLISGDRDLVPMVQMVQQIGPSVHLIAAQFKRRNSNGIDKETRTSKVLIKACHEHTWIINE